MNEDIELRVGQVPRTHAGSGRPYGYISTSTQNKNKWTTGDILEITGSTKTYVIARPLQGVEDGLILIDGPVRRAAGVSIDDTVHVRKVVLKEASYVELAPTAELPFSGFENYLLERLSGGVFAKDQEISLSFMGNSLTFVITKVKPESADIFQLNEDTEVVLSDKVVQQKVKSEKVSYEDIGGLSKEIQKIREVVELPMKRPELFERLSVQPPRGILLSGHPGTGKTLLARAVASETNSHFILLNGPEIISKYFGGSEENLRKVFDEAQQNQPSIIMIDEIDSIAPKREEVQGEVERRVVATLLTQMDGLKDRGKVVVIAATNRPDSLDEALRRGGRFDREIEIGIPDARGRLEILQIHTRGMPLAKDVDLQKLADSTHGYVGADLASLSKEAAMSALRRILPTVDINKKMPVEKLKELNVTMTDFQDALSNVEPSAMREVYVEKPNVHWSDIGGLEQVKRDLQEAVEWPLKYKKTMSRAKLNAIKGILLSGGPGTGKTLLAKAVATESEANFISVKGAELLNKYVGESQNNVRKIFKKARAVAPVVLFFDELDALAPVRSGEDTTHATADVVAQLLTEMDGLEELRGVLVLGATNRPDIIDPALLRQGRFNSIITVGMPDLQAREQIAAIHLKDKPTVVTAKWIAEKTEGLSGADIAGLIDKATRRATREYLEKHPKEDSLDSLMITELHFNEELGSIKTSQVKSVSKGQPYLG